MAEKKVKKAAPKKAAKKKEISKAPKKAVAKKEAIKKEKAEKEIKIEKAEKKEIVKNSAKYFYGLGKRKTAVAQVRIYPNEEKGNRKVLVNNKEAKVYFPIERLQEQIMLPFAKIGQEGKFDISAKVFGGGVTAQAEAVRLGISRALVKADESFKKPLRDLGFLTRDPRIVERKKPGLKKARRAPQWAKR
jgi:small subunit ribosomal protein S9